MGDLLSSSRPAWTKMSTFCSHICSSSTKILRTVARYEHLFHFYNKLERVHGRINLAESRKELLDDLATPDDRARSWMHFIRLQGEAKLDGTTHETFRAVHKVREAVLRDEMIKVLSKSHDTPYAPWFYHVLEIRCATALQSLPKRWAWPNSIYLERLCQIRASTFAAPIYSTALKEAWCLWYSLELMIKRTQQFPNVFIWRFTLVINVVVVFEICLLIKENVLTGRCGISELWWPKVSLSLIWNSKIPESQDLQTCSAPQ